MSPPSTRYTNLCSSSIRRDQQPASTCLSGSGLPIPSNGERTDSSRRRINSFEHGLVMGLPVEIVLPPEGSKDETH